MSTTVMATTARVVPSKAHGTKATAQAMSLQAQRELNVLPSQAQASHPCASHSKQLVLVAFKAAQINSRLVQPS
ncbi:hypothetical protein ACFX13_019994 [Malus domestica]